MNKREKYLNLSYEYFRNEISIEELITELKKIVTIKADKIELPMNERIMIICNHPAAADNLSLPAEHISELKGGNSRNFPSHWFPIVRQTLLKEAMGKRRFLTLAYDIGWKGAMQEMGHLLIHHSGNGRCKKIISCMEQERDCSLVVFPEGGARNLEIFHTGFFYIACALKIRYLVVGTFSPILSLDENNEFKIIQIEDIGELTNSVRHFVEMQRHRISTLVVKS